MLHAFEYLSDWLAHRVLVYLVWYKLIMPMPVWLFHHQKKIFIFSKIRSLLNANLPNIDLASLSLIPGKLRLNSEIGVASNLNYQLVAAHNNQFALVFAQTIHRLTMEHYQ